MIELESVSKTLDQKPILREVSLQVRAGERLVIVGASGSGKTTLLRLVAGFLSPDRGCISIGAEIVSQDGQNLVPPERRNLGMVFQDLALWPHMNVRANLEFGLKARGLGTVERQERVREMLSLVRLEAREKARPSQLSGGERQRVALARALVTRPEALLMDEPLSSLDEALRAHMRTEILRLHGELGFTLLYVTHNREEAADIATRLIRIRDGRIEPGGAPLA